MKQRKIKFRIIYLEKNELEAHNNKCSYWTPEEPMGDLSYMITSKDYIVSQYTGLKDRNGKEIYEGDIVEWEAPKSKEKEIIEIKWSKDNNAWDTKGIYKIDQKNIEIIGNIYENKDLLK